MRVLASLPLLAAVASAGGLDFSGLLSASPELATATPAATATNTRAIAQSIVAEMKKSKPSKTPKSSTRTNNRPKTTTTTTTAPTPTTPGAAEAFAVRPGVLAVAGTTAAPAATGNCAPQQQLYAYTPNPNTPQNFLVDTTLAAVGSAALPPAGYSAVFSGRYASINGATYVTYFQLSTYDIPSCAALCDRIPACQSFNIYFERAPTLDPGADCPNPTAGVNVRCALWGSQITAAQAVNIGQWRTQFMNVIQSSAGYVKNPTPATVANYSAPIAYAGALNVNGINGKTVFLAQNYVSGTLTPSVCASQCNALTTTNRAAAQAAGNSTYSPCNFFNVFNVVSNYTTLGYYCALYSDSGVATGYPVVYNSTYNGVSYSLTNSYGYALSTPISGTLPRPQFAILSAYLADADVTASARAAFLSNNATTMVVDTTFPSVGLGTNDPWPGNVQKSLSILYTYGTNETRIWSGMINNGISNQTNAYYNAATAPGSTLVANIAAPAGATIRVAGITWGPSPITVPSVYSAVYAAKASNSPISVSNDFFTVDTLYGYGKSGVIWYYSGNTLLALAGLEYEDVTFP